VITTSRKRRRTKNFVVLTIIILGALPMLFPFYWQITTSLKSPNQISQWPPTWFPWPLHFENYRELAEQVPLLNYLKNSVLIVSLVVIGTVSSCSFAAYAFARSNFPGRSFIFLTLVSAIIIPSFALLIPQFIFYQKIGWYDTFYPLIVPAFFGNAFYIFLLRQYFMGIPRAVEDAARIDGAGFLRTFLYIILPMSKPALVTVAVFTFVSTWNDFSGPLIFLTDDNKFIMPIGLIFFQGSPRSASQTHLLMAMSVLLAAPCVILYFIAQRAFIGGITVGRVNR